MSDRDCDNCAHHSEGGCSVWECSFERKKDDTISRQAAIDAICGECQGNCIPCKSFPCGEIKAVQALPSAQPTQIDTSNTLKALDCVERLAAIDALMDEFKRIPTMAIRAKYVIEQLPPAQPDSCEFYDTESHFCALHRPSAQQDRSLWFHIGETCVDESKGIISAKEAIKKIRELLRAADLILVEIASPNTFTEPKFHHEDWSEIL